MDFQAVNMDAAEAALRLIGGDQLLAAVTSTYEAIHAAELRGQQEGFNEGHAIGVIDGRAAAEERPIVKPDGAHEDITDVVTKIAPRHTAFCDAIAFNEQPSDEGLEGLDEIF